METMVRRATTDTTAKLPCCPQLGDDCPCDVFDFQYRLVHPTSVRSPHDDSLLRVEVIIHVRFERCPGELALGDLVYTTTLLPAEKVRLFTADRRSRFTFDQESKVSYRHEHTAEERYYMASLHNQMSDLSVRDSTSAESKSQSDWDIEGSTNSPIAAAFVGGSVEVEGSHSASSTSEFLRELSVHAQSSDRRSVFATRSFNSISIGEVQSRTHAEGESADHFESSSREFSNPNHCHAITFYFYRINKTQKVRFIVVAIQRRVIDPAGDTKVKHNPPKLAGGVAVTPTNVLATDLRRLELEQNARASVAAQRAATAIGDNTVNLRTGLLASTATLTAARIPPLPDEVRLKALNEVEKKLVAAGLINREGGDVSKEVIARFSFESCSSLPTPGLLVKGCLDECNVCEDAVRKEIQLDLERKALENELLKRQIELLEKSQEYRCCPGQSDQDEDTADE